MTTEMAFTGVLSSIKQMKTTGELQFTVTVASEMADEACGVRVGLFSPASLDGLLWL